MASPRQQRSDWGLRVTQNAHFSLMMHTKQLLLLTFCYTTAGIGATFRTHGRRTANGGRTDRRGSRNSYLDDVLSIENLQKTDQFSPFSYSKSEK